MVAVYMPPTLSLIAYWEKIALSKKSSFSAKSRCEQTWCLEVLVLVQILKTGQVDYALALVADYDEPLQ